MVLIFVTLISSEDADSLESVFKKEVRVRYDVIILMYVFRIEIQILAGFSGI